MKNNQIYLVFSMILAMVIFYVVIELFNFDVVISYVIAGVVYGVVSYLITNHKLFK